MTKNDLINLNTARIAKLLARRETIQKDCIEKLESGDNHGVADAAMDLRELEVKIDCYREFTEQISKIQ